MSIRKIKERKAQKAASAIDKAAKRTSERAKASKNVYTKVPENRMTVTNNNIYDRGNSVRTAELKGAKSTDRIKNTRERVTDDEKYKNRYEFEKAGRKAETAWKKSSKKKGK